jgi:tetratricopeptide (TPR) repeat protein
VAAAGHAADHGWPGHATRLAASLSQDLFNGGHFPEARTISSHALDAARRTGDRAAEAVALELTGDIDWEQSRFEQALDHHGQALAMFHDMGAVTESLTLVKLSTVYVRLGRYEQATRNLEQALAMSRETGNRLVEADALNGLGDVLLRTGEADQARVRHATALQLASEAGAPLVQAHAHAGLGRAYYADGDPFRAGHHWVEALTRYTAIGAPEADEIRAKLAMAGDDPDDDAHVA